MSIRHWAVAMAVAALPFAFWGNTAPSLYHRPIIAIGSNQSNNWSGYNQGTLEQGGKLFNQVAGTWIVPTTTRHKAGEAEYSSTWVGIAEDAWTPTAPSPTPR